MRESLSRDMLFPVVLEAHLEAMDRRLKTILNEVQRCFQRKSKDRVLKPEPRFEDYKEPEKSTKVENFEEYWAQWTVKIGGVRWSDIYLRQPSVLFLFYI